MRLVVCALGGEVDPWKLPASELGSRSWIHGGERSLYELAVAAAAAGHQVELRGEISEPDLRELGEAAGAMPAVGFEPRRPATEEVIVVPEGWTDPLQYARIAFSPARAILLVLAAPGLEGWPFAGAWSKPDPLTVPLDSVGRPEHYRAMAALGLELWTNSPRIADEARTAGVDCLLIGRGIPVPFPDPPPKRYDVVTVQDNRWAPLADRVVAALEGATHHSIPRVGHDRMLQELGAGRILAWPSRIEGQSRVQLEARAMGTVPVALSSNRYAVGLDEESGSVLVDSLEEMPAAIGKLLHDPTRLSDLAQRAALTARDQVDWDAYVERVDAGLRRPRPSHPAHPAMGEIGRALQAAADREASRLRGELEEVRDRLAWSEREFEAFRRRRSVRVATRLAGLARSVFRVTKRRAKRGRET